MKKIKFVNLIFSLVCAAFFSSCGTLSVASKTFLENEGKPVFLNDLPEDYNINGIFPEKIYIKTLTQTFGFEYEFCIFEGKVYYKKIGTFKDEWKLFLKTGLPPKEKRICEIAADADCLYVFSDTGKLYRSYLKKITHYKPFTWIDYFGWPKKIQLYQNESVKNKFGWAVGSSRKDVEYYTDINGNEHNYGPLGVESITMLLDDGKTLRFSDPACPSDFSHTFRGPDDNDFYAEAISESASTIFLADSKGNFYTRLVDYNTVGLDPMLYEYTYDFYADDLKGSDDKSNTSPWCLPNEEWKKEPLIKNAAYISSFITIIQTGKGNDERELRVAGINNENTCGYFYKKITEEKWEFFPCELNFSSKIKKEFSKKEAFSYEGFLYLNEKPLREISCSVENFSFSEGPLFLRINCENNIFELPFYYSQIWTPFLRLKPGYEDEEERYYGTMVLNSGVDFSFNEYLDKIFSGKNKDIHSYYMEAGENYFMLSLNAKGKKLEDNYVFYLKRKSALKENTVTSPYIHRNVESKISRVNDFLTKDLYNPELKVKVEKNKSSTSNGIKSILNAGIPLSKILFIDKISRKVGIITTWSGKMAGLNKDYYSENYKLWKKYLNYYSQYEKLMEKYGADFSLDIPLIMKNNSLSFNIESMELLDISPWYFAFTVNDGEGLYFYELDEPLESFINKINRSDGTLKKVKFKMLYFPADKNKCKTKTVKLSLYRLKQL